jgi:hypothetical protein
VRRAIRSEEFDGSIPPADVSMVCGGEVRVGAPVTKTTGGVTQAMFDTEEYF